MVIPRPVRALPLLACLALGGCYHSTLVELRESPPTRTAIVPSTSYQTLAGCVLRRLEESKNMAALTARYRFFERPELKMVSIVGSTAMGTDVGWFLEAKFQEHDAVSVSVETRKGSWVIGSQSEPVAWDAVSLCTGR